MSLKLYLSPQARETATVSYLRNPVVPTGRTRRRWFFLTQYEYEGPVYVTRWQTPFNMERWPREKYWSYTPPSPIKPRVRIKCGQRALPASGESRPRMKWRDLGHASEGRFGTEVKWRGTTGSREEALISISFVSKTGEITRLMMGFESAAKLRASINTYVPENTGCHSDRSSGIPISDGSLPQEGQFV